MFEKLAALFQGGVAVGALHTIFKETRKTNSRTADALLAYSATGKNPEILLNLSPADLQAINYDTRTSPHLKQFQKLVSNPDCLSVQQWMRLGMVYALSPRWASMSVLADVPRWFMSLQYCKQQANDEAPVWEPAFMQQLLNANGVSIEQLPQVIITSFIYNLVSEFSWENALSAWRTYGTHQHAKAFAAYVDAHSVVLPSVLNRVSAAHRVSFAEWLKLYPELIQPLAPTIAEWAVGPAKTVREAALALIGLMPEPLRAQTLAAAIDQGKPANLGMVIDYAARSGEVGRALLEAALVKSQGDKRSELLSTALQRSQTVAETPEVAIEIPPVPALDTTPLGDEFELALEQAVARWITSLEKSKYPWAKKSLLAARSISSADVRAIRSWLNGQSQRPRAADVIPARLFIGFGLTLLAAVRASLHKRITDKNLTLDIYILNQLASNDYDLRSLLQAAEVAGLSKPLDTVGDLGFSWYGLNGFKPADLWPFYAEHPEWLDQALGIVPRTGLFRSSWSPPVARAIQILEMFPTLPAQYVPILAQYATGEGKTYRRAAQELLEGQPNVLEIAEQGLSNSKGEIRAAAAAWIGRIGNPAAIPSLRAAFAKEKRELPQAAMLNALSLLGDDISADVAPEVLAAAAKKGLSAKLPAGMAWFPLDALPACRWADGSTVEPETIRWWAVLGVKLKDPKGAGLIPLYVSLLDDDSKTRLGMFVLDAWIAQDTRNPPDELCREYAAANVDSRYSNYQSWFKRSPQYYAEKGAMTKDQVQDELYREKSREYLGTAIGEKGLLALSTGAPGHYVLSTTQRYIRDHGSRRAQVEALIIAAAANDDPSAIQLVLSVARKFKQETVRLKAVELAEEIAERRGWTLDELADRTIPTAGFEENGVLTLDFGPRCFSGRVSRSPKTGAFTIEVFNAEGKAIKALPKPGVNDNEELAGESRKQLTASKKELGQVVKLQTSRLFEAMCLGRTWDAPSWQEYLLAHPIMRHLVSTLVWKAWKQEGDDSYQLFRPSADGELLDAKDEALSLSETSRVGLAHLATVSKTEAEQWRSHLKDYEIEPLFSQFESSAPTVSLDAQEVEDHLGWLSDSFAIRGRATKRGYTRGQAEDGGWFSHYYKPMPSAQITVTIAFTGAFLPEEQITASVERLSFMRNGRTLTLREVPPILLAESYADYVFIAEAGAFDPEWESKSAY